MKKTLVLAILMMGAAVGSSDEAVETCQQARGQGTVEEQERRENECLKKLALEKCKGEAPGENKRICVLEWLKARKTGF